MEPLPRRPGRRSTATSSFGVGRREGHDASEFYRRFNPPDLSRDEEVCHPDDRPAEDRMFLGDLRDHPGTLAAGSVALVVTSPPYYSGKDYETAVGEGHVPGSYTDYLSMLTGVFAACVEALEPGGRLAVNVANLGRKPYRSLSADVTSILSDDLGLLLRGEVIWQKARGAGGNCAWGTFQRPGDPVLRDLTERVLIASKGRFDRAVAPALRAAQGLPSEATITRDEFLEATVDLWEIPPQSATRAGHPAPFPVELPQRLIDLYTYRHDLVVDPFMGSGSTAVAALRTDRRFVGYDTDASYVSAAVARLEAERRPAAGPPGAERRPAAGPPGADRRPAADPTGAERRPRLEAERRPAAGPPGAERRPAAVPGAERRPTAVPSPGAGLGPEPATDPGAPRLGSGVGEPRLRGRTEGGRLERGIREGRRVRELARWALEDAGFVVTGTNVRLKGGVVVHFAATGATGEEWLFDVAGAFTATDAGLARLETVYRLLGKATVVQHTRPGARYVLLASQVPSPNSPSGRALGAVLGPVIGSGSGSGSDSRSVGGPVRAVLSLTDPADLERLGRLRNSGVTAP